MNSQDSVISFMNVSLSYGSRSVLESFNMDIMQGDKVLLFGKSGTGKSSVLRLVLGFTKPDAGSIFFCGEPLDKKTVWNIRKRVSYVSQDLDLGTGEVEAIAKRFLVLRINNDAQCNFEDFVSNLQLLGFEEGVLNSDYEKLSGGEKQRVFLSLALSLKRNIFLLDEPTSSLDKDNKSAVIECFSSLKNATILCISHDSAWLEREGFRAIMMEGEK